MDADWTQTEARNADRTQTGSRNTDRTQTESHNADRTQTESHNADRTQTESRNTDRTQTDWRNPDSTPTESGVGFQTLLVKSGVDRQRLNPPGRHQNRVKPVRVQTGSSQRSSRKAATPMPIVAKRFLAK